MSHAIAITRLFRAAGDAAQIAQIMIDLSDCANRKMRNTERLEAALEAAGRFPECLANHRGGATARYLGDFTTLLLDGYQDEIFCDGTQPLRISGGGFVPSAAAILEGEVLVASEMARQFKAQVKCWAKAVVGAATARGDAAAVQKAATKAIACSDNARARYDTMTTAGLAAGLMPACLIAQGGPAHYGAIADFFSMWDFSIYCASPSGAFID